MKNRLCELLGIKYPIIQGGMAWSSDGTLAAAVSNAGGAGTIGTGGRSDEWVEEEIKKAKSLTDKPFGVNLMLMAPNLNAIADIVCKEKVAFVTTGAGSPVPWIEPLHKAGVKVIPVVPNVKLAKRIAASGADAMVIEGMEGGGHIGTLTSMALLSNVLREKYPIPVLAAGGISDGRAMAAALLMGADGVQMGSRFLLTTECPVHPRTKEMIVKATDTDCVVTGQSRKMGVRCLANAFTRKYLEAEISGAPNATLMEMGTGTSRMGMKEGDTENGSIMVGQSLNVLNEVLPCKDVVEKIIADAKAALAKAATIEL
jgi:enoyl-[acyl-carrier protein] reductase II